MGRLKSVGCLLNFNKITSVLNRGGQLKSAMRLIGWLQYLVKYFFQKMYRKHISQFGEKEKINKLNMNSKKKNLSPQKIV